MCLNRNCKSIEKKKKCWSARKTNSTLILFIYLFILHDFISISNYLFFALHLHKTKKEKKTNLVPNQSLRFVRLDWYTSKIMYTILVTKLRARNQQPAAAFWLILDQLPIVDTCMCVCVFVANQTIAKHTEYNAENMNYESKEEEEKKSVTLKSNLIGPFWLFNWFWATQLLSYRCHKWIVNIQEHNERSKCILIDWLLLYEHTCAPQWVYVCISVPICYRKCTFKCIKTAMEGDKEKKKEKEEWKKQRQRINKRVTCQ